MLDLFLMSLESLADLGLSGPYNCFLDLLDFTNLMTKKKITFFYISILNSQVKKKGKQNLITPTTPP
jgi:hypothetical protein